MTVQDLLKILGQMTPAEKQGAIQEIRKICRG
jgi:hypothetical protein